MTQASWITCWIHHWARKTQATIFHHLQLLLFIRHLKAHVNVNKSELFGAQSHQHVSSAADISWWARENEKQSAMLCRASFRAGDKNKQSLTSWKHETARGSWGSSLSPRTMLGGLFTRASRPVTSSCNHRAREIVSEKFCRPARKQSQHSTIHKQNLFVLIAWLKNAQKIMPVRFFAVTWWRPSRGKMCNRFESKKRKSEKPFCGSENVKRERATKANPTSSSREMPLHRVYPCAVICDRCLREESEVISDFLHWKHSEASL